MVVEGIGSGGEGILMKCDEECGMVGEGLECGEGYVDSFVGDVMNLLVWVMW